MQLKKKKALIITQLWQENTLQRSIDQLRLSRKAGLNERNYCFR